jgi:hypothetical protein
MFWPFPDEANKEMILRPFLSRSFGTIFGFGTPDRAASVSERIFEIAGPLSRGHRTSNIRSLTLAALSPVLRARAKITSHFAAGLDNPKPS